LVYVIAKKYKKMNILNIAAIIGAIASIVGAISSWRSAKVAMSARDITSMGGVQMHGVTSFGNGGDGIHIGQARK
jgi:hypothetical protein